ncbi:MAG: TIGR02921 family PEP-CTERM protein [Phormidesmis sp. RL_2_1]|nr:TIGR02921 family PEP-CTERM protein [Phormidesmis sp. RL_2_1]
MKTLIKHLKNGLMKGLRASPGKNILHIVSHLVFWVWNLVFIGLMYLWFLPQYGLDLLQATRIGEVDLTFTISFAALMIVPLISTLLGFVRLRKYPVLLMRLFYGVEAPLFTLCLLRMFLIRELTLATGFTLGLVVVAIAMFAIELLSGYAAYRPRLAQVQMISHSLMLLVGLYVGILLLLYSLPVLLGTVIDGFSGLWSMNWWSSIGYRLNHIGYLLRHPGQMVSWLTSTLVVSAFGFLSIFTLLIFLSMPYVFTSMYVRAWARIRTAFGTQHGHAKSLAITGITLTLSGLLFVGVQSQPQVKAFNLLAPEQLAPEQLAPEQLAPALTPEALRRDRQTQLQQANTIRAGLTNAYLQRYRYLSPWSQSDLLKNTYLHTVRLNERSASLVQTIHNGLLSPFLYRGERGDVERAADLYAQFLISPFKKVSGLLFARLCRPLLIGTKPKRVC